MKRPLVGTALLMSATTAWAIPFTETYDVTVKTWGSGLQVTAGPDDIARSAAVYAKSMYRRGPVAVPQPMTLALIGGGLLLATWLTRRR